MANESLRKLALRVKELRAAAGLTQQQVSERSGLHITYIADIEGGRRNPSFVTLLSLAKGLGVSLSELTQGLVD